MAVPPPQQAPQQQPQQQQQQEIPDFPTQILAYLRDQGYEVEDEGEIRQIRANISRGSALGIIIQSSIYDLQLDPNRFQILDSQYELLSDFITQLPRIEWLQLKPLLFAFFFHTVIFLFYREQQVREIRHQESRAFFDKHRNGHHPFHNSDIKKLLQLFDQYHDPRGLIRTSFNTFITDTAYQSLIAFLMDNSMSMFLSIVQKYVKFQVVQLDYFTSRQSQEPGFILHTSDNSADHKQLDPQIKLIQDNPIDLALSYLGPDRALQLNFSIFDDDPRSRLKPSITLPPVLHDRVLATASDLLNMKHLSKTSLPSCAYFTFNSPCSALDINSSGTLIAAAEEGGPAKLFATDISTDLDDFPAFSAINSRNLHLLVPRAAAKDGHHYTRSLIGPRAYCCRFSPESRLLLCGGPTSVRMWNCESYGAVGDYPVPGGIVWAADWSPFGVTFVTGHDSNLVSLWSVDHPRPLRYYTGHQDPIIDVKYHPNAVTLASCSEDRSIRVWDIREAECVKVLAEGTEIQRKIQFTRSGRIIVSGDNRGGISTWDIREGRKIGTVQAHRGAVYDITVSVEGTIIATTGEDGEVLLWDTGTLCGSTASGAEPLKRFAPANSITTRLAFSSRNLLHALGVSADVA